MVKIDLFLSMDSKWILEWQAVKVIKYLAFMVEIIHICKIVELINPNSSI